MNAVALITPTYSHDLERCALLCESVDRHVGGFTKHYLIVPDHELAMFARFAQGRRQLLPLSQLMPSWLKPLPRFIRRHNRQYWWSTRGKPVNGWHVQQFAKIATALIVPETVSCVLDSDVVFFRPFDLSATALAHQTPLYIRPREVTTALDDHCDWVRSSHRLLGLERPSFPADDFIGHIIFWNQQAARAMTARIEEVTGRMDRRAVPRPRHIRVHAVRLFRLQRRRIAAPPSPHDAIAVLQLLGPGAARRSRPRRHARGGARPLRRVLVGVVQRHLGE
jgi:hypothetical protein